MTFDISRSSFDPKKNYQGVVMQQGRVQLDSDWNEWVAELNRRTQAGTLDAVGTAGVPSSTPDGFKIKVADGCLTISPGRMYVDGLLVENHGGSLVGKFEWNSTLAEEQGITPVNFLDQPYLHFEKNSTSPIPDFNPPAPIRNGRYLVYLDVWQRCVTPLHDPGLIEKAVGVDTTGRIQTVWQVKVLEDDEKAKCSTPDHELSGWAALTRPSGARLTTSTGLIEGTQNPCLSPLVGGYFGLENQLYRVEIHKGGNLQEATFKWSRDNGSVATRVLEIHGGSQLVVESLGRDEEFLGFRAGDWVEVVDDWHELHGIPGQLRRISPGDGVKKATHTLILENLLEQNRFPVNDYDVPVRPTRIRRWDQAGKILREDGTTFQDLDVPSNAEGIKVAEADGSTSPVLALEAGIQVRLTLKGKGLFKTGDHWIFTARSIDGSIERLHEAPPAGIHHHFARLAVVKREDKKWLSQPKPSDCRTIFPPLTDITAEDVSYLPVSDAGPDMALTKTVQQALDILAQRHNGACTVVVGPKDDLKAVFAAIEEDSEAAASVCFKRGTYNLSAPIVIDGKKQLRLRLSGCGRGSHLVAANNEAVVMFKDCVEVIVRDLSVESGVQSRKNGLQGTLDFTNCDQVEVSGVAARCAGGGHRAASCITVRRSPAPDRKQLHMPSVRISDCDLMVGHRQVGVLVINACTALIESNRIHAAPLDEQLGLAQLVAKDPVYRAQVKSTLIGNPSFGERAPAGGITNVKVQAGHQTLHFHTPPDLMVAWDRLLRDNPPSEEVRSGQELLAHFSNAASEMLSNAAARNPVFAEWFRTVERENVATLFQGIVVAGQVAEEVRVRANTIEDCLQGIHVGVSHKVGPNHPATGRRDRDDAGTVHLSDNTIEVVLPQVAHSDERHAIFVGNADSVVIEANRLKMRQYQNNNQIRIDGIRVHGYIGPMLLIQRNHLTNFTTGIAFTPRSPYPLWQDILWLIEENLAEKAFPNHTVVYNKLVPVTTRFNRPSQTQP